METNNVTQWVIIGAAVLVLVVGGAWLVTRNRATDEARGTNEKATTTQSTTTSTVTGGVPNGTVTSDSDGESVRVEAQAPGSTVRIASMELTRASWIAIRDDRSILGAAWFPSSATGGEVHLQRATESGKSYRAVIYVDDGDKKFDYKKDRLITSGGNPVGSTFTAN